LFTATAPALCRVYRAPLPSPLFALFVHGRYDYVMSLLPFTLRLCCSCYRCCHHAVAVSGLATLSPALLTLLFTAACAHRIHHCTLPHGVFAHLPRCRHCSSTTPALYLRFCCRICCLRCAAAHSLLRCACTLRHYLSYRFKLVHMDVILVGSCWFWLPLPPVRSYGLRFGSGYHCAWYITHTHTPLFAHAIGLPLLRLVWFMLVCCHTHTITHLVIPAYHLPWWTGFTTFGSWYRYAAFSRVTIVGRFSGRLVVARQLPHAWTGTPCSVDAATVTAGVYTALLPARACSIFLPPL